MLGPKAFWTERSENNSKTKLHSYIYSHRKLPCTPIQPSKKSLNIPNYPCDRKLIKCIWKVKGKFCSDLILSSSTGHRILFKFKADVLYYLSSSIEWKLLVYQINKKKQKVPKDPFVFLSLNTFTWWMQLIIRESKNKCVIFEQKQSSTPTRAVGKTFQASRCSDTAHVGLIWNQR